MNNKALSSVAILQNDDHAYFYYFFRYILQQLYSKVMATHFENR